MFHFTATAKYIWKMWEKNKCCWLWVISTSHQIPGALCFFVLFKTNEQLHFLTNRVLVLVLFKSTNLLLQLILHYYWSGVCLSGQWDNSPLSPSVPTHTGKHTTCSMKRRGRSLRGCPLPPQRPRLLRCSQHTAYGSAPPAAAWSAVLNKWAGSHPRHRNAAFLLDWQHVSFQPCSSDTRI